ncbi:hypothetical protein [Kitasatospora sp. NPDC059673]|uniref:hypothetical protein n=1 Tax=Kitasatospora sp. NPDC059673 TaxID=3346901 RepID=UPI0036AE2A0F
MSVFRTALGDREPLGVTVLTIDPQLAAPAPAPLPAGGPAVVLPRELGEVAA